MSALPTRLALALMACMILVSPALAQESAPSGKPPSGATQAPPSADPAVTSDIRSPSARSTRYSAYVLSRKTASIDLGFLGISGDELYGRLGTSVGLGYGLQLEANLGHWVAGLFGLNVKWAFFENEHVALSAQVGFLYAHGGWLWLLDELGQTVFSDSDLFGVPLGVTVSVPWTRWLQFDLLLEYQYSKLFGSINAGGSFYAETQFGARQLLAWPTLRVFITPQSNFHFTARLPLYNRVPYEIDSTLELGKGYSNVRDGYASLDFSQGWALEFGVRSQVRRWLFVNTRLHVGQIAKAVYGAVIYPSFNLEFRVP